MIVDFEEELLIKLYTDVINSAVFNTPINFLQRYPQIEHYRNIVDTETQLLKLLYQIVAQNIEKASKIAEFLNSEGVSEKIVPLLSALISNKIGDLKRQIIRKQICRGGACLIDHNWRISSIVSSNVSALHSKCVVNLSLIIENSSKESEAINEVGLEMNVHELEEFLNKLKSIRKAFKV